MVRDEIYDDELESINEDYDNVRNKLDDWYDEQRERLDDWYDNSCSEIEKHDEIVLVNAVSGEMI